MLRLCAPAASHHVTDLLADCIPNPITVGGPDHSNAKRGADAPADTIAHSVPDKISNRNLLSDHLTNVNLRAILPIADVALPDI
jgi:hypothetical protein